MTRNTGKRPAASMVDIRYRCGLVVRGIQPKTRRWTIDDPDFGVAYPFDIASWQPSENTK